MDNDRLVVLLQNAIDLIRYETQWNSDEAFKLWIMDEFGMTDEEFNMVEGIEEEEE